MLESNRRAGNDFMGIASNGPVLSKIANLEWPSMRGATGVCGGARPSRSIKEETYVCRSSLTHRRLFRRRERAGNGSPSAVLHRAYCRARRGLNLQGLADIKQWKAETKKKYQHTVEPLEAVQRDGETIVTTRLTGKRFDARYPSTRRRFAGRGQQSHFRRHSKYLTQSTWSHSTLYVGRYSSGEYWAQVS